MRKQRTYGSLLILGASILLFRTIRLLTVEGGWVELANWVVALTLLEMIIDILCIAYALFWLLAGPGPYKLRALGLGAAATFIHGFRVLIYVLGRTAPFLNFDVKPAYRSSHQVDLFWVYFAAILSILGILGVIIIFRLIRRAGKKEV